MKCIYCLRESSRSRSVAHAVAEALYPHGPVMPPGAICDHCNHYFGANLESMLVQHPAIALPMQLHGLPGKTGKPRAKLGTFERDVEPGYSITFPSTKPEVALGPDGHRSFTLRSKADPSFDMKRFSRALHLCVFNLATLNRGLDWALASRRDQLRQYIRRPKPSERWTFVQMQRGKPIQGGYISVTPFTVKWADIVRFRVFSNDFIVDLDNTGCLETARLTPADGGWIVGKNWKAPKQEKQGTHHYRVSIE